MEKCEFLAGLCDKSDLGVQHLLVKHVDTGRLLRCFDALIPTKPGTFQRRKTIVQNLCQRATGADDIPWIIAGDLNLSATAMMSFCRPFLVSGISCQSYSGHEQSTDAQKADHAVSHGIDLDPIKSWVGKHSTPCASDVHDAVVVRGTLQPQADAPGVDGRGIYGW